ncbi:MAG: GAF domain-containing protein [Chloroflexi bacterium]|nr:GAF domain-containing protein [Chloroflexota bacterium]
MNQNDSTPSTPRVVVIADIETNAISLVESILRPGGVDAYVNSADTPQPDVLVVDITQLMGDPLAGLRNRRSNNDDAPAIILAARFPQSKLRDFFRLGVADILLKPYRSEELLEAVFNIAESRSRERSTQSLARKLESSREHTRQRSEEIRLLSEIGRTVVSLADLDRILARLVEAAVFVTDAEEANIYLAESDTNELVLRASKHAGASEAVLQRLRADDSLVGQVFQSGQAMLKQPSLEGGPMKIQTGFLVRSLINVPIRSQKQLIGVLGVYNRLAARAFTEHHQTLLSALADWAGVALDYAQLLRQVDGEPTGSRQALSQDQQPIKDALERLHDLMTNDKLSLTEAQLGALEGLKLTLMRGNTDLTGLAMMDEKPEMIELPAIVENVMDEWQDIMQQDDLKLAIGPILPLAPFPGNPKPIHQIISNLVGSAINRTQDGRVVLNLHRFEVENGKADGLSPPDDISLEDGLWMAVTVADSSPGLSREMVAAITSKEIDPSAGREGLGLSMGEIRLISSSIGAYIWHDQSPAGTTIIFAIPIA